MILACDVGGTKTNVALLDPGPTGWQVARLQTFQSRAYRSLNDIISAFVGADPLPLEAAGFGVAGPVIDYRVVTTNLPWTVEGAQLASLLSLPRVSLLNDLEVFAWALPELGPNAQLAVQDGRADAGNLAVIAAGSGLGMSALLRGSGPVRSLASEGGHADYAPIDDLEVDLLRFLRERHGRVSSERVLSGPGLVNIYEFLRHQLGGRETPSIDTSAPEAASEIGQAALGGMSELAERAVLLFLGAYGAAAGNWALATLSTGGLWLGGGIARKLLEGPEGTSSAWRARARETFLQRFRDKGRLSPLLESMPVHIIMTDEAPLIGAARFALTQRLG